MKIAIYCRVSPTRKEQKEFTAKSIKDQLEICRNHANIDKHQIYKEYIDQYVSGKAQEYMLSFQQMVKDAKDNKFEKIYCRRVDRFGRNLQQMVNTQKELQILNIHLKFVEQGLDTSETFGRMVMGIMASISEWQRETILENTKIGREIAYEKNPEKFGAPKKDIDWNLVNKHLELKDKDNKFAYSWSKISRLVEVTPATLLRRYRKEIGNIPIRNI